MGYMELPLLNDLTQTLPTLLLTSETVAEFYGAIGLLPVQYEGSVLPDVCFFAQIRRNTVCVPRSTAVCTCVSANCCVCVYVCV